MILWSTPNIGTCTFLSYMRVSLHSAHLGRNLAYQAPQLQLKSIFTMWCRHNHGTSIKYRVPVKYFMMTLSRVTFQQNPINNSCSFGMYRCMDKRYKSVVKSSVHVVASIVTPVLLMNCLTIQCDNCKIHYHSHDCTVQNQDFYGLCLPRSSLKVISSITPELVFQVYWLLWLEL